MNVRWFDAWDDALDAALQAVPEMESCPQELYRVIATTRSRAEKRFALVGEGSAPVAVVALRRRHRHWQLVCDGVVPYAAAPAAEGRLWDALSELGVYLRLVEWPGPLPSAKNVRFPEIHPNYAVSTRIDFDAHWAKKGNKDWLRKMRNRTSRLGTVELEVDAPGAATWTIEQWHEKFEGDEMGETLTTEDALAATEWCVGHGRMRSFRLLIDGRPVAGMNMFVHGTTMATTHSYSDPAFAQAGVGVHLHELMFRWAASSPYERVDMGCGDYKGRWADESGIRTSFAIAPAHLALARTGKEWLRRVVPGGRSGQQDITSGAASRPKQKLDSPV
jgi:hypothetical protein